MVDLVEFSVVDITKGRMDIQLCGHGRGGRTDLGMSSKSSNETEYLVKVSTCLLRY
jgi:hypothetical protein